MEDAVQTLGMIFTTLIFGTLGFLLLVQLFFYLCFERPGEKRRLAEKEASNELLVVRKEVTRLAKQVGSLPDGDPLIPTILDKIDDLMGAHFQGTTCLWFNWAKWLDVCSKQSTQEMLSVRRRAKIRREHAM